MTDTPSKTKRVIRSLAVVFAGLFVVVTAFRLTEAGSLTPAAAPAANSMASGSLDILYDALASTGYDSSLVTADADGSAFGVAKCIILKMTGGTLTADCPL